MSGIRHHVRRLGRSRAAKPIGALLSLAFWVIVWHVAAARLNEPLLLPTPLAVWLRLVELGQTSRFWLYSLRSLLRVMLGIASGALAAIVTAALTAGIPFFNALLRPLITVIKTTPVASFIILAMLWLNEDVLPVFISFLMVFPVIWANLHTALEKLPSAYRELCSVYRLPFGRRIRRVYVPFATPYFLSACQSSMGLAWKAGVAAEAIALPALSIGKQLMDSKYYLETTDLFAWTVVVILLSLLLELLAMRLFRRLQSRNVTSATKKEDAHAELA